MELETQVKWGEWWRDELAWQGKELAKVANKISLLCFSRDSTTSWDHFKTLPMSSSLPPSLCLQTLLYSCYIMCPGRSCLPWAEDELAVSISSNSRALLSCNLQSQGTHNSLCLSYLQQQKSTVMCSLQQCLSLPVRKIWLHAPSRSQHEKQHVTNMNIQKHSGSSLSSNSESV